MAILRIWQLLRALLLRIRFRSSFSIGRRSYLGRGVVEIAPTGNLRVGRLNLWEQGYFIGVRDGARVTFGDNVFLNRNVKVVSHAAIELGDDCILADSVHMYDHDHGFDDLTVPIRSQPLSTAPIKLESDVWIGAKATILKGVTIGRGSVIAAGSVVTHDIPPYSIAGGVPAHVIKMRSPDKSGAPT